MKEVTILDFFAGLKITELEKQSYKGNIDLRGLPITSLKHFPKKVYGSVFCGSTNIESLEGGPEYVSGHFNCTKTAITSLKGAPKFVGGNFNCSVTKISSLEYAPKKIGKNFLFHGTNVKSLHNIEKYVSSIGNILTCNDEVTHVLGVLRIKNLKEVMINGGYDLIIGKHLRDRDVFACQDELIDAGFVEQAKL